MKDKFKNVLIMGVPVIDLPSYAVVEEHIIHQIQNENKTFTVAINPEKICRAQHDRELMKILQSANILICDGVGVSVAARILYGKKIGRITGLQLFFNLIRRAEREKLRVFLLGAKSESNEGTNKNLKIMNPDLQVVGRQDGYFNDSEAVIKKINESQADMLFVAMGSPRQEKWIKKHMNSINASFFMGVGGAFDVINGHVKWAPKIFRKTGTEWFYRLIIDPKRIRRQVVLPVFALKVFKEKIHPTNPA